MTPHSAKIELSMAMGARTIIKPFLPPSPLRSYPSLDRLTGARLFVKHENQNPTGTFKIRGGLSLMHHLKARRVPGVITYSTGNHGTSVAASAKEFGIKATVVVPENSNPLKCQSIKDAGATLIEYGANFEAAGQKVTELVEETRRFFCASCQRTPHHPRRGHRIPGNPRGPARPGCPDHPHRCRQRSRRSHYGAAQPFPPNPNHRGPG